MTINSKIPNSNNSFTREPDFPPIVRGNEFLPSISRWMTWGGLLLTTSVGVAIALSGIILRQIVD